MSASNTARLNRLLRSSIAELDAAWLRQALVTTQVVDLENAELFPEMALLREHARKLRENGK